MLSCLVQLMHDGEEEKKMVGGTLARRAPSLSRMLVTFPDKCILCICVFKYRFREGGLLKHELVPCNDGAPGRRALSFTHVFLTAADIARPVLSH